VKRTSALAFAGTASLVPGVALLAVSVALAWSLDEAGDARVATMAQVLSGVGAALLAVGVALLSLLLVERGTREGRQEALVDEARAWLDAQTRHVGAIVSALRGIIDAPDDEERLEAERTALQAAQGYYEEGQELRQADRLIDLIDDDNVKSAIREADGRIRGWNELVAGDDSSAKVRFVELSMVNQEAWDLFMVVSTCRDEVATVQRER